MSKVKLLWLFHNCVAHPLLGLFPRSSIACFLHDVSVQDEEISTEST